MLDDPKLLWLAATVAVELVIAPPILGKGETVRRRLLAVLGVNLVSFPLALSVLGMGAEWLFVEGAVVVIEGVGYAVALGVSPWRSMAAALGANVVTASLAAFV